ncbi:PAS domain S-box protein [Chloroflexota bacterium]
MLAIVIVASISFPLLRYGDRQWRNSIEETIPIRDSVLLAKSYLSKGFLFLEKRLAGDETIRIDDVLYMFSQADQLIQDSIEGHGSITILQNSTPTDPELIDKLEQFRLEVERFGDISRERWEKRELPDIGITIQQRSSFYLLEYMANDITILLDQKTGEAFDRQGLITSITLSVWIVVLMIICYLLFRGGRRRWLAEEEVRNYQTNLEGLVKERTNELVTTNDQLQQEITERTIAEQNFRNSLDNSPLGARIVTTEGELLYTNQAILNIYGYGSFEELKTTPTKQRYTPESYIEHQKRIENRKLGVPIPDDYEISIVHKDGAIKHLHVFRKKITWNGEANFLILYQDITERKKSEEDLKESEEKWRSLVENAPYIIILVDQDRKIQSINHVISGLTIEDVIGKSIYDYIQPEFHATVGEVIDNVFQTGNTGTYEIMGTGPDGKTAWYETTTGPLHNDGQITGVVQITSDITERKRAEEREKQLNVELNSISRLATVGEMAAGISHEINNPLTGVIGFSDLLLKRDLPEDIRKDVDIIHEGARRIASIIDRMLRFARQTKTAQTHANINDIIETTLAMRVSEMKTSNIEVTTKLAPDLPLISVDAGLLQQSFLNIILNAEQSMKEAHGKGNLTVKTERIENTIRASFKDDGPGIAKENLDKLFNPFFTTKDPDKGTGLGLSICYSIVNQHGGKIYAESILGKGATFFVELPVVDKGEQLKMDEPAAGESKSVSKARILVVDDEPMVHEFVNAVLTGEGHELEMVDNGDDAIERLGSKDYDVILLDIKLPGKSGIEIYEELQKNDTSITKKIIFITGDVMSANTMDFIQSTRSPYITKPFDTVQLVKGIDRILSQQS